MHWKGRIPKTTLISQLHDPSPVLCRVNPLGATTDFTQENMLDGPSCGDALIPEGGSRRGGNSNSVRGSVFGKVLNEMCMTVSGLILGEWFRCFEYWSVLLTDWIHVCFIETDLGSQTITVFGSMATTSDWNCTKRVCSVQNEYLGLSNVPPSRL